MPIPNHRRIQIGKLDALLGFCETLTCRRVRLLEYFGESAAPCGNCDTCLTPPVAKDGTKDMQKLLSTIYRVGQRFGALHVIDVLRGISSERVYSGDTTSYRLSASEPGKVWRNGEVC